MFKTFSNPELFSENGGMPSPSGSPAPSPAAPKPVSPSPMPAPSSAPKPAPVTPSPAPKPPTPAPSPTPAPKPAGMPGAASPIKTKVSAGSNYHESYSTSEGIAMVMEVFKQYMDIHNPETLNECMALNEAEQNSLLLSLTNKLYHMIVGKVDAIDFGDIPNTKGDIRRLPKYKQLKECIETLHDIFEQYKEDTKPVDEIDNALSNIENNRDLFIASYAGKIEVGIIMYNTMALAVINSISFMIAVCIEYVKNPKNEGLTIVIDKTGISKVQDHLVYENLVKFNDGCKKGDIEKVLRPLIQNKVKNFAVTGVAGGIWLGIKTAVVIGGLLTAIVPLLRDLVYFFFAARARVSSYLDIQADLLEMNANEIGNNEDIKTESDRNKVITRQLTVARMFHQVADKIAVEARTSEVQATRDIKNDTKKYRMDEVNANPANDASDGPLF